MHCDSVQLIDVVVVVVAAVLTAESLGINCPEDFYFHIPISIST